MPPGRTHDLVNATVYTATAVGVTLLHAVTGERWLSREEIIGYTVGFLAGTLWLSPDLDKDGTLPLKRWGPLKPLWFPYVRAFKHRGLSHGYLFGPLTRLLYLGLLLFPTLLLLGLWNASLTFITTSPAAWWIWGLLGYYVSSWCHLVADRAPLKP